MQAFYNYFYPVAQKTVIDKAVEFASENKYYLITRGVPAVIVGYFVAPFALTAATWSLWIYTAYKLYNDHDALTFLYSFATKFRVF